MEILKTITKYTLIYFALLSLFTLVGAYIINSFYFWLWCKEYKASVVVFTSVTFLVFLLMDIIFNKN